jgi:hypothetical protein
MDQSSVAEQVRGTAFTWDGDQSQEGKEDGAGENSKSGRNARTESGLGRGQKHGAAHIRAARSFGEAVVGDTVVGELLQALQIVELDVTAVTADKPAVLEAREYPAHRFFSNSQIVSDITARHAQVELIG